MTEAKDSADVQQPWSHRGFLNRYSDTLAVVTDSESADWACQVLTPTGWQPGKHTDGDEERCPAFPRLQKK